MVTINNLGIVDTHAHILPGIDDGARDFDDSIAIVRGLVEFGVTDIVATPHYILETEYISPKRHNLELLKELEDKMEVAGVEVNLYLGNEIYINDRIVELIEAGEISTMAGGEYLLVELPMDMEYPNYGDVLRELISRGYKVLLAHPERYQIVQENNEVAWELHDMGVLFQCNLRSILGRYGTDAKQAVQNLMKDKLVFAFATDAHHAGRSDYVAEARKKMLKYYNEREISQLLAVNPRKILM